MELIGSGIQPIQNLAVLKKVSDDPDERKEWAKYWIEKGLRALEAFLEKCAGDFCVGNAVTLADCCLIPQLANGTR